jgi:hypothetical protein
VQGCLASYGQRLDLLTHIRAHEAGHVRDPFEVIIKPNWIRDGDSLPHRLDPRECPEHMAGVWPMKALAMARKPRKMSTRQDEGEEESSDEESSHEESSDVEDED